MKCTKITYLWFSETHGKIFLWCLVLKVTGNVLRQFFHLQNVCLTDPVVVYRSGLEPNAWLSVRETYGWRMICLQSCSLACGITENPLKLTHDLYRRLRGLNLATKWTQTCIWMHGHKHTHTTASWEGTLNLFWNHKYTDWYQELSVSVTEVLGWCFFSERTNSSPAQKCHVDALGFAAHRRLSLIVPVIKIIDEKEQRLHADSKPANLFSDTHSSDCNQSVVSLNYICGLDSACQ